LSVTVTPKAVASPARLVFSAPSVTGDAVGDGRLYAGSMTILVGVANTGGTAGGGAVQFQYSTDNTNFYDWLSGGTISIGPGGSATASGTWTGGVSTYFFRAHIGDSYSPSTRMVIIAKQTSLGGGSHGQLANTLESMRALLDALQQSLR